MCFVLFPRAIFDTDTRAEDEWFGVGDAAAADDGMVWWIWCGVGEKREGESYAFVVLIKATGG